MLSRRQTLGLLGSVLAAVSVPRLARAGVARAVPLTELVKRSVRIVHGMPMEGSARWETIGGQRRIVSYMRFQVDEHLLRAGSGENELYIRLLGGQVDGVGQIVHGEATVTAGQRCLVFLSDSGEGFYLVTAMAQGHYPMLADSAGTLRLRGSAGMPAFSSGVAQSAVRSLVGQSLDSARTLIRGATP
jgi:hypothetical protein